MFHVIDFQLTKCFLLPCEGGYLQIDTAYPHMYPAYLKKLSRLGIGVSEIRYLLLTHHHDDHAGFASALLRDSGAALICHREAVAHLAAGCSAETMHPLNKGTEIVFELFTRFLHRGEDFGFLPVRIRERDILLNGDDLNLLPEIGVEGVILHTPGHTADSISVVLSNGEVFCGDVAMSEFFFQMVGIQYRPIYIEDEEEVFESWDKIISHGGHTIHPAHGASFDVKKLIHSKKRILV